MGEEQKSEEEDFSNDETQLSILEYSVHLDILVCINHFSHVYISFSNLFYVN